MLAQKVVANLPAREVPPQLRKWPLFPLIDGCPSTCSIVDDGTGPQFKSLISASKETPHIDFFHCGSTDCNDPDCPSFLVTPLLAKMVNACILGDANTVETALSEGIDINAQFPDRRPSTHKCLDSCSIRKTPLLIAVPPGHVECVQTLLACGADPNLAGSDHDTPLMLAAANGQLAILHLLLKSGAATNLAEPTYNMTAFFLACVHNNPARVSALIQAGCDTDICAEFPIGTIGDNQKCLRGTGQGYAESNGFVGVLDVL